MSTPPEFERKTRRAYPPLRVVLGRSRALIATFACVYGGGCLALLVCEIPVPLHVGIVVALAVAGVRDLRLHGWRCAPDAVVALARRRDGRWLLETRAGGVLAPVTITSAHVHPGLVSLRFAAGRRRIRVLAPADGVDMNLHRALRVALRQAT